MAQDVLLTRGMSTNTQILVLPVTAAIYAHETTELSAIALAMVGFVERLQLGLGAGAQRRDLKASANKMRLQVSIAGGACSAKRRRAWYQRAQERVASFAFALLDLQQSALIAPDDFAAGRALAVRGKALLDAQLAALSTMPLDDQHDVGKLDALLLAADRAASAGTSLDVAYARTPAAGAATTPQEGSAHAALASTAIATGMNGGSPRANPAAPPPDKRPTRS